MIKGIGIDIIEIERIKEAVDRFGRSFLDRIFTDREQDYCRSRKTLKYPELAVRFSAKEAYAKAAGTGITGTGLGWKDIEVVNDARGKPQLSINDQLDHRAHLSLSHSRDYAVAAVYLEE